MTSEQQKKLDSVLLNLQKKYGKDSISVFGKNSIKVERVPLSSMNLTELFGGGCPRGRMLEVYGPESSGKTTLAETIAADYQKHYFEDKQRYGVVAYIDVEHAFDPGFAESLGLKVEDLLFSQPNSAEQALDIVNDLVLADVVDLIVVDSVAALVPQAEADGEMGDQQMGLQARLMSKACRKLNANMTDKSASILWINQIREKIGVMFGNPETTTGGNALKFYASVRMTIRRKENVEKDGKIIGIVSRVKTIKNKVAPPFRECELKLIFGKGYQTEEEYVAAFVKRSLVEKSGSWFTIRHKDLSVRLQGGDNVVVWFKEHKEVFESFKQTVQEMIAKESSVEVKKDESEEAVIAEQTRLEKAEFEDKAEDVADLADQAISQGQN